MRPSTALVLTAALASGCSRFQTQTLTAADLDAGELRVQIVGGFDPRQIGGALNAAPAGGKADVCGELPGFKAIVDGHQLTATEGGVGQVLAGSGSGGGLLPGTVEGCIPPRFGSFAFIDVHSPVDQTVPVTPDVKVTTVALKSDVRDVTMKIAGLYAERTVRLQSASPGQLHRGETVSLVLSVESDQFTNVLAGFGTAQTIGSDPWSAAGTKPELGRNAVSFKVPDDWPLGKGKLSVRWDAAPAIVACEGVGKCSAELTTADVQLDAEVLP